MRSRILILLVVVALILGCIQDDSMCYQGNYAKFHLHRYGAVGTIKNTYTQPIMIQKSYNGIAEHQLWMREVGVGETIMDSGQNFVYVIYIDGQKKDIVTPQGTAWVQCE